MRFFAVIFARQVYECRLGIMDYARSMNAIVLIGNSKSVTRNLTRSIGSIAREEICIHIIMIDACNSTSILNFDDFNI